MKGFVSTDRRRIRGTRRADLIREARERAARFLDERIGLARVLAEIAREGAHRPEGCNTMTEFGTRLGLLPNEVPGLVDLGTALDLPVEPQESRAVDAPADAASDSEAPTTPSPAPEAEPTPPPRVEDLLRAGAMPIGNAIQVGRFEREDLAADPKDAQEWRRAAEVLPPSVFRRNVNQRREEVAQAERTVRLEFHVTESGRDAFRQARKVASRKSGLWLTEGQTLTFLARRYLAEEARSRPGSSGRPAASPRTRNRHVPAAEARAVFERSGGNCEIPACPLPGDELAHNDGTYAGGAPNDQWHLTDLCRGHHVLTDAGVLRFAGWGDDGRPLFRGPDGRILTEHDGFPVPRREAAQGAPAQDLQEPEDPQRPRAPKEPPGPLDEVPRLFEIPHHTGHGEVHERPPPWYSVSA